MGLILDTSFVVEAEREARRRVPGVMDAFLAGHAEEEFHITFTVAGELACGDSAAERAIWKRLLAPYPVIPWSLEVAWHYGVVYRALASRGALIGTNDIWIAATAIAAGMGVVTRNVNEFGRVPGLPVVPF